MNKQKQIIISESEIDALKQEIEILDRTFIAGKLNQDEYLKKKNVMAEKLGTLMGQRENLDNF